MINDDSKRLHDKLQIIENVLRFQVLGNVDTISNSITNQCERMKIELLKIMENKGDLNALLEPEDINSVNIKKIDRIYADLMECIGCIVSSARSSEDMIKNPIRVQFKSISGIRRFEIKGDNPCH
jgi:predicted house-cleaning noncanonical NTP pyrophosphatase (MazG superfamily)